ncbi:MAG: hypothetical protein Q8R28_04340, partial [Dehalococcoidia bacterium]|nr:hypothetical protein [Dehalococcoidia bacterium]
AHRALTLLEADVGEVLRTVGSERLTQAAEKLWQLGWQANRRLLTGANVDAAELVQLIRAHDVVDDVFKGLTAFASYLIDETLSPSIVRNPSSPIEGMSEEVEAEQFSPFELKSLLEQRAYPFGPRLNSYLRDLLLRGDDLVPRIRSLLPGEVASSLTDEEVRDIATRALTGDGAD